MSEENEVQENPYEESLGLKEIIIGKTKNYIFPIEGDNIKIANIMGEARAKGLGWLYKQFNALCFLMLTRPPTPFESECNSTRVPVPPELHAKLQRAIELNQSEVQKQMLVLFGWQTKAQQDELENMGNESLKKLAGL